MSDLAPTDRTSAVMRLFSRVIKMLASGIDKIYGVDGR